METTIDDRLKVEKEEKKSAVVFAGGGSKGAYQAGAMKALDELGERFEIATGTSIGSINAAFYVQGDFDAAYEMWNTLTVDDIMTNGVNLDRSLESVISQREQLLPFVKTMVNKRGADVRPFHEKLKQYFNAEKFFSSPVDFALVTVRYPSFTPVEIHKKDMERFGDDAWQWLAASGACFPVFPVMRIEDADYVDGGYFDNIPVAPAFRLGATDAVVIDLKTEKNHAGYLHHPRIKYIKPSRDLGAFLNFGKEALRFSIKLGYDDTMKAYGKYYGREYTFLPGPYAEQALEWLSDKFMDILTEAEARFDFSGSVRFQRVNNLEGCTTLLASSLGVYRPTERELLLEALECFLRVCGYTNDVDYNLTELTSMLKSEVDRLYPMLEYDFATAFDTVCGFITAHGGKAPERKKQEDDRMLLIYTSLIRALQQMPLI